MQSLNEQMKLDIKTADKVERYSRKALASLIEVVKMFTDKTK